MSLKEIFLIKNHDLQRKTLIEIENVKNGISQKNVCQLYTILDELKLMEKQFGATLTYPRMIIDSWDYADQLGLDLVELSIMYKKIR